VEKLMSQTCGNAASWQLATSRNRFMAFGFVWPDWHRSGCRSYPRRGLADHKRLATTLSGRQKPAFGGPNQPVSSVAALVPCTTSHGAPRLGDKLI